MSVLVRRPRRRDLERGREGEGEEGEGEGKGEPLLTSTKNVIVLVAPLDRIAVGLGHIFSNSLEGSRLTNELKYLAGLRAPPENAGQERPSTWTRFITGNNKFETSAFNPAAALPRRPSRFNRFSRERASTSF